MTPQQLVSAICDIFKANNYDVVQSIEIHGAQVDIRAQSLSDPFAPNIYVEATVDYVDVGKYGKDLTKLVLVRANEPRCVCLIISSTGFTDSVTERATQSGIDVLTFSAFSAKFERFDSYLRHVTEASELSSKLSALADVYIKPLFNDHQGKANAVEFLTSWCRNDESKSKWLIITGEYGSGKTALTEFLQRSWTIHYRDFRNSPIPFRIELRDMVRAFDADGLLHHFLDRNNLSHIPINYAWRLIHEGRIVLLLDGYDEMAQFLHARERRSCLEALGRLSAAGARGILTSRPNYFSEA